MSWLLCTAEAELETIKQQLAVVLDKIKVKDGAIFVKKFGRYLLNISFSNPPRPKIYISIVQACSSN